MKRLTIALGLAALVSSCGSATGEALPEVPPSVDLAALREAIQPRSGEDAVLVNFWATWCPPCIAEMPTLTELYAEHAGGNVRVVTVSLDMVSQHISKMKDAAQVGRFARRKGFELPIVVYEGDPKELYESFEMDGAIPVTIMMTSAGEVARHRGSAKRNQFDRLIRKALE